jgi:predicted acetyltransferase
MDSDLTLRRLHEDEEAEFLRAHRATSPAHPNFLHHYRDGMDFRRYLEVLEAHEHGRDLPPGVVPTAFLFACAGDRIVGRITIRSYLNASLERNGGHIGYVVVPEFRRRGYATRMLAAAVRMARQRYGLSRVLLTVDDDNIGSIRTIEKNGGVFEGVITRAGGRPATRRYWIET